MKNNGDEPHLKSRCMRNIGVDWEKAKTISIQMLLSTIVTNQGEGGREGQKERDHEAVSQIKQIGAENIKIECLETWCIGYISHKDVKRVQIKLHSTYSFSIQLTQSCLCLVGTSAWHHIVEQHLPGPAPRGKMEP